ncbi:hypothetical protein [Litorimonas haliclonae]|uniref:hypothetical protein n=1 Tax=Litorimonas haliclonae TaxID=2081977 RepID=UPI0039EF41CF
MKRTNAEKQQALQRAKDMVANNAIEGLITHPDDRAFLDDLQNRDLRKGESIRLLIEYFQKKGLIPNDYDESSSLVAE